MLDNIVRIRFGLGARSQQFYFLEHSELIELAFISPIELDKGSVLHRELENSLAIRYILSKLRCLFDRTTVYDTIFFVHLSTLNNKIYFSG